MSDSTRGNRRVQKMGWGEAVRCFIANNGAERATYRKTVISFMVVLRSVGVFAPAVTFLNDMLVAVPVVGPVMLLDNVTWVVLVPFGIYSFVRVCMIRRDANRPRPASSRRAAPRPEAAYRR